jgi:hypothetical protein
MQQTDVDLNVVLDKRKSNSEIFLVMNIAIELYIVCINYERTMEFYRR